MSAKSSLLPSICLFLLSACDKSGGGEPIEPEPEPAQLEAELANGPWTEVDHFCASLEAEACAADETIISILSEHRQVAASAGNMIELSAVISQTGDMQTGHLLLRRGDEGYWALPSLGELEAGVSPVDHSLRVMNVQVPEGNENIVLITSAQMQRPADLWHLTQTTFACQVDPAGPVACARFTSMRAHTDEGVNEDLPYLEALFVPVGEGLFEVTRMDENAGVSLFGSEVIDEGRYHIAFP